MSKKKGPVENGRTEGNRTALLAGLALVALLAAVSCGTTGGEQATAVEPQAPVDLGPPSLGEEDAPVVLIEYSDLQ